MSASEFHESVNFKRFSHLASIVPLVFYLPFGCLLGIIRLFIFLHALLLNFILPERFPFKRLFLKVMFFVTGIPISVHGSPHQDKKKILVGNSVTNLDPFILSFLWPNTLVVEDAFVSKKTILPKHITVPGDENHDQVLSGMKEKLKGSKSPLLFFPERFKTNGKHSLLKFHQLAFELDTPIQPVTIQTSRFVFDVAVSTVSSSLVEDLFWCLVFPMTLITVKFLPVTERKNDETSEGFASRVQVNMAKSMGIRASSFNSHDVIEYVKRKPSDDVQYSELSTPSPSPNSASTATTPPTSSSLPSQSVIGHSSVKTVEAKTPPADPELTLMHQRVADVFPDIPSHCILSDLKVTRDVDATITNILEGKVDTAASPAPSTADQTPKAGLAFKAKTFERQAAKRQLSFAERKQAMLESARLKYKQKHGLL